MRILLGLLPVTAFGQNRPPAPEMVTDRFDIYAIRKWDHMQVLASFT
jgi:hypothetical protein